MFLLPLREKEAHSRVEPEVHHVTIDDHVLLALEPELAGIARPGLALQGLALSFA
jgi:hypothetical protein